MTETQSPSSSLRLTSPNTYIVQEGDSLMGVALKFDMTATQIRRINSLYGSSHVFPGQLLKVFDPPPDSPRSRSNLTPQKRGNEIEEKNLKSELSTDSSQSAESTSKASYNEAARANSSCIDVEPLLFHADLCVRDSDGLIKHIEGKLSITKLYIAFKHKYVNTGKESKEGDFNFLISVKDVRDCEKLYIGQHKATEDDVEDNVYIQIVWENLKLGYILSSIFIRLKEKDADQTKSLLDSILKVTHSDGCSGITSGSCLLQLTKTDLKYYFEYFATITPVHSISPVNGKKPDNNEKVKNLKEGAKVPQRRASSYDGMGFSKILSDSLGSVKEMLAPLKFNLFDIPETDSAAEENIEEEKKDKIEEIIKKLEKVDTPLWIGKPSRILKTKEMQISLRKALPKTLKAHYWKVLYNFEDHGVALKKLYEKIENVAPVLLVIETTNNDVFGYLALEPWNMQAGKQFYGTGEGKLFHYDKEDRDKIIVFDWTKKNNRFMNSSSVHLAVGSGGHGFAICLDGELERGTSFSNETYGNPGPLCVSEPEGESSFVVSHIEAIGFESSPHQSQDGHAKPVRRRSFFLPP